MKTVFQTAQGKKTIDVYWIADDGGEPKKEVIPDQTNIGKCAILN